MNKEENSKEVLHECHRRDAPTAAILLPPRQPATAAILLPPRQPAAAVAVAL
jgi:hypothetical protein